MILHPKKFIHKYFKQFTPETTKTEEKLAIFALSVCEKFIKNLKHMKCKKRVQAERKEQNIQVEEQVRSVSFN